MPKIKLLYTVHQITPDAVSEIIQLNTVHDDNFKDIKKLRNEKDKDKLKNIIMWFYNTT